MKNTYNKLRLRMESLDQQIEKMRLAMEVLNGQVVDGKINLPEGSLYEVHLGAIYHDMKPVCVRGISLSATLFEARQWDNELNGTKRGGVGKAVLFVVIEEKFRFPVDPIDAFTILTQETRAPYKENPFHLSEEFTKSLFQVWDLDEPFISSHYRLTPNETLTVPS